MDSSFYIHLGLSFVVGGLWVTISTIVAEKYGSKIGGLIGGLPSTAAVALLFIGITQTPLIASESTTIVPIAQGLNGIFMIVFILFSRRGLIAGMGCALLVWSLQATFLVLTGIHHLWISIFGWMVLVSGSYIIVEKVMQIPSRGSVSVHYSRSQILFRAIFSGAVISFAVFMGRMGGPMFGGVFATFPAMFISTLIITYISGGKEFSQAIAKSMMVSGTVNVGLYAIVVRYSYPMTGLLFGTIIALLCSCITGYATYLFISKKVT